MPAVIIPVGQFIGAFSVTPVADDSEPNGVYGVRLGTTTVDLDEQEFGVWALARGIAAKQQKSVSVASLRSVARRAHLDDASATMAALTARGLITTAMPVTASAEQFARSYRLLPLGLGLGNTAAQLPEFTIGNPEFPRARVSAAVYDLWAFSPVSESLWLACENASAELDGDVPASDLARLMVQALPVLLATDAAYVDVALTPGTFSPKAS